MNLSEIECIESVKFGIGLVATIPYKANSWNAEQFLIKEHWLGVSWWHHLQVRHRVQYRL